MSWSGSTLRFMGLSCSKKGMAKSGTVVLVASVMVRPGAMQFTRTPNWPSWPARWWVRPMTPHLLWA